MDKRTWGDYFVKETIETGVEPILEKVYNIATHHRYFYHTWLQCNIQLPF